MVISKAPQSNRILILLATGFEETPVVYCVDHMREAGLPISLVGLSTGLIKGLHGLMVRPDISLDQIPPGTIYQGVIVPGGQQCVSSLLTDPRVHQIFEATLQNDGFIAAMATAASQLLAQSSIPELGVMSCFVEQADMEISEFTEHLINLLHR